MFVCVCSSMRKCPTLLCGGRWVHGLANSTLPYFSRYSHLWVKHPALWHPALAISWCSFPPASSSSANGFLSLCPEVILLRRAPTPLSQTLSAPLSVACLVRVYMGTCVPQPNCPLSMASPRLTPHSAATAVEPGALGLGWQKWLVWRGWLLAAYLHLTSPCDARDALLTQNELGELLQRGKL